MTRPTAQLDRLRGAEALATKGRWLAAAARSSIVGCPVVSSPAGRVIASTMVGISDAAFIAAARNDLPAVLAYVAELEAALAKLTTEALGDAT